MSWKKQKQYKHIILYVCFVALNKIDGARMKLLIFSDIHYPIGRLETIESSIDNEKPNNVALLGDNIELSMFRDHKKAYREFYDKFDNIFPIRRSIVIVGDNDYQYSDMHSIRGEIDALIERRPINRSNLIFFKIGNANFFHGNLEKQLYVEKLGQFFVKSANHISYDLAPQILSGLVRMHFKISKDEYLFLGHLHYLRIIRKNVFCGTLNYRFMPFPASLGYVAVEHNNFRIRRVRIVRI
ncbi:MAG: metallophosphoesterase family protein [Candidatus Micrarchaeaceae archaeon]